LQTGGIGKGDNVLAGLRLAVVRGARAVCMFDSDLTSFEPAWVNVFLAALRAGKDLVTPKYARYWIEGGTTNHLCVPVLSALVPNPISQPIAGDFGFSERFARRILDVDPTMDQRAYGIDMLISGLAIFERLDIVEVTLGCKIHKPSFDKTEYTFIGGAS